MERDGSAEQQRRRSTRRGRGDLPRMLGDGLTGRLERWAAEARVDEAARRRTRERWLLQQAEEEGTFAGVLADLAERGSHVAMLTRLGGTHVGHLAVVGDDFVAVRRPAGPEVLVRLDELVAVRTSPGERRTVGDRQVDAQTTLSEVMVGLAGDRERVTLVLAGGSRVTGRLTSMGDDVMTVRPDAGDPPGTAYVPLAAVVEVLLGT